MQAESVEQMDRQQLLEWLSQTDVQAQLIALGVDVDHAKERIQHLTTAELQMLNQQIDELPAGSGLVGLLVLLFIVFVITDALGATDLFPFVKPIDR